MAPWNQAEGHGMLTAPQVDGRISPRMDCLGIRGKVPATGWFLLVVMVMRKD